MHNHQDQIQSSIFQLENSDTSHLKQVYHHLHHHQPCKTCSIIDEERKTIRYIIEIPNLLVQLHTLTYVLAVVDYFVFPTIKAWQKSSPLTHVTKINFKKHQYQTHDPKLTNMYNKTSSGDILKWISSLILTSSQERAIF